MPYQKRSGWLCSYVQGLYASAPITLLLSKSAAPLICLSEDAEKTGILYFLEASKMATASSSEAAIGLSMNMRLPAANTSNACSRWSRPSLVSKSTTSTCCKSSLIERSEERRVGKECTLWWSQ